jgi:hypothetical protein
MSGKQMQDNMPTHNFKTNNMQKLIALLLLPALFACSDNDPGKQQQPIGPAAAAPDSSRKSIPSETTASIGGTELRISYHAPAVRGRTIWGGLVPYNDVWVTGAHRATALTVGKDFRVGEQSVPAGKYALFTIPGEQEWTVIINKNWDQHLADDYSQAEDVARVKVKPESADSVTERLKYAIKTTGGQTGEIIMSWEKIRIKIPVVVNK